VPGGDAVQLFCQFSFFGAQVMVGLQAEKETF